MFVLGKCCICFYLQILVNLGALCFSRTDGSITTTSPALLSVPNPTALGVRSCLLISGENSCLGRALSFLGLLGWAHRRGWTGYFCWCSFSKQCTGFSAAWIRCQSLFSGGCTSYWSGMDARNSNLALLRNPGALWLFLMLFQQPEKSSLWLQTVQSPFFCPPFVQFGLAPSTFFMEKQILSKSHFGDSEMSYLKNMDGYLGHLTPLVSGTITGELWGVLPVHFIPSFISTLSSLTGKWMVKE